MPAIKTRRTGQDARSFLNLHDDPEPEHNLDRIIKQLKKLDDGVSRPVTIMERQVCGEAARLIENTILEIGKLWGKAK
jgi:hypothetical protein